MSQKNKSSKTYYIGKIKVMSPPPNNWIVGVGDIASLEMSESQLLSQNEADELHRVLTKLFA